MKHIALYFGMVAALVASCSTQEEDFNTPLQDDVIFYASFEQPAEEGTRVYANEDLLLRWTADDRVSIFNKLTYNQEFKFLGETGDNAGGFNRVDNAEFVTGNAISHVVSVYPYQPTTKITEEEVVTLTLPSEQHYAENTFGLGANTMVSVSEDNILQYKNVGGYLMLKLYGEGVSVSSITLKGNNGEKLAGKAVVTMPLDGTPTAVMADDSKSEITLTCETPFQLGATAEGSTQFWFVVPPVTFSNGFTITIDDSFGRTFKKSTSKSVTINRNNLSKMSPMEVILAPLPQSVDLGLPSGLKWASFNLGASRQEEFGDFFAWGETEPYYSNQEPLIWKEGKESGYAWSSYKWSMGSESTMTKYCNKSSYGYNGFIDRKKVLDPEDDAAYVNLGGYWRMPTDAEWAELIEICTWTWTRLNEVSGYLVTGPNGNSIFLPAAGDINGVSRYWDMMGCYLSSSLWDEEPDCARYVWFYSDTFYRTYFYRYGGFSIRPVEDSEQKPEDITLEPIDLGLSVKWSPFNLGASRPEEYGDYFAWGETEPKLVYSWSSYNWSMGSGTTMTKYCSNNSWGYNGFTDDKTVLDPEDDAAHVNLGGYWRMPTDAEWAELIEICTWTWTRLNEVSGFLVTSPNGNSIFLPSSGACYDAEFGDDGLSYWSSSLDTGSPYRTWIVSDSYSQTGQVIPKLASYSRYLGFSIRPVSE